MSGPREHMNGKLRDFAFLLPKIRGVGGERLWCDISDRIPRQRGVRGDWGGSQVTRVGGARGELEIRLDSGGICGVDQRFRYFCGRNISAALDNAVGLGTVPGILHSEAICKARETIRLIRCPVWADRPGDPVVT